MRPCEYSESFTRLYSRLPLSYAHHDQSWRPFSPSTRGPRPPGQVPVVQSRLRPPHPTTPMPQSTCLLRPLRQSIVAHSALYIDVPRMSYKQLSHSFALNAAQRVEVPCYCSSLHPDGSGYPSPKSRTLMVSHACTADTQIAIIVSRTRALRG